MDRNVLLLYLRELRDLEITKRKITNIFNKEKEIYTQKVNSLSKANVIKVPEEKSGWTKGTVWAIIICFGVGIIGIGFLLYMMLIGPMKPVETTMNINGSSVDVVAFRQVPLGADPFCVFMLIGTIMIVLFGVYLVNNAYKETQMNQESIVAAEKHNEEEMARVTEQKNVCGQIQQMWRQRAVFLKSEYDKVNILLESYYNLNIIANPYRNLASLYYIYDYMSSSQESLKSTLIHEHIKSEIQKILQKLDIIIGQNQQEIFQNRILEAGNQVLIEQNKEMIDLIRKTELNTERAEQYAEISAYYSETNTFFSCANYLKG